MKTQYYVVANHPHGYLVMSKESRIIAKHATEDAADKDMRRLNTLALIERATRALQFLDEMGGPEPREYCNVMRAVGDECYARANRCEDTHLSAFMLYTRAGFSIIETGGGCRAWRRELKEWGMHILITAAEDADVPECSDSPVTVSLYANAADHSEPLAQFNAKTGAEALERIAAGVWGAK